MKNKISWGKKASDKILMNEILKQSERWSLKLKAEM